MISLFLIHNWGLEELLHPNDKLLTRIFTRLSDELEAMGAVSKQVFWKAADHFLGITGDKESQKEPIPTSIREDARAEKILDQRGKKGFWTETPGEAHSHGAKIPIFQKALTYEGSHKNLENIAAFIEEKLYAINAYTGTRLAYEAKEELQDYMKMLGKDRALFQALKDHNQQLVKEAQRLFQEQMREQEKGIDRAIDFSM